MAEVALDRIGWKDEPDESTPLDSGNLKKMEDNFETFVKAYWEQEKIKEREILFPIGSRFLTDNADTNPADILGIGTWERFDGLLAVGIKDDESEFNQVKKVVGAESNNYDFSHNHSKGTISTTNAVAGDYVVSKENTVSTTTIKRDISTIQPTEVVGYMWIRRR